MSDCVTPNINNHNNYVFDTNILNRLAKEPVNIELCNLAVEHGYCFFITDVQIRELNGIPDRTGNYADSCAWRPAENAALIFSIIRKLHMEYISCVALLLLNFWTLDGSMRILDDKGPYYEMFQTIHNKNPHHLRDATIAESTIYNHCKLISNDKRLRNKMNSFFPNSAMPYDEFINMLHEVDWRIS